MEAPGSSQTASPNTFAVRKQQLEVRRVSGRLAQIKTHYKAVRRARFVDGFVRRAPLGALCIPDKLPLGRSAWVRLSIDARCDMRCSWAITAAILFSLTSSSAFALSGGPSASDRWNPQHVDSLPADIRNAVIQMCGQSPKAERAFTSYFENSRRVVLHFEHFRCDGRPLCTKAGCLQQVYIFTGGHYRLLKSYYGLEGN
jgi:hypothetical protein